MKIVQESTKACHNIITKKPKKNLGMGDQRIAKILGRTLAKEWGARIRILTILPSYLLLSLAQLMKVQL
jgi:hypothetical protein